MNYDVAKKIHNDKQYYDEYGNEVHYDSYRLRTCPQCGKKSQRCTVIFKKGYKNSQVSFEEESIVCMDKRAVSYDRCVDDTGIGVGYEYIKYRRDFDANEPARKVKVTIDRREGNKTTISGNLNFSNNSEKAPELIGLIDSVYGTMRGLLYKYEGAYLYKEDRQDLLKRFLPEATVRNLINASLWEEDLKTIKAKKLADWELKLIQSREIAEVKMEVMGFFSVPSRDKKVKYAGKDDKGKAVRYNCSIQTAIAKDIVSVYGKKLLNVPGFVVSQDKKENEFITFRYYKMEGYFIPYRNANHKVVAMQYRLTTPRYDGKGKIVRYFWYSSENASSGSPIDHFTPFTDFSRKEIPLKKGTVMNQVLNPFILDLKDVDFENNSIYDLIRGDVMLMTEGATKGRAACQNLKLQGLFEAGVGNYRRLIKDLIELEKETGIQYKVILALDMDKYTNVDSEGRYPVLEAEKVTIQLLKATGHQVAIAEWDGSKAKGIDDALQLGLKVKYKLI